MSTGLNILWLVCGGFFTGLAWYATGAVAALTVVGLPWARACFMIGNFSLAPFGREVVDRKALRGRGDLGTGSIGLLGNVVWFLLAGWWLALGHVVSAVVSALTVIGIPFAIQHLKLAGASVFPVGKAVVNARLAEHVERDRAARTYRSHRRGR